MKDDSAEIDHLLSRAQQGDPVARDRLLDRHRERLKRMVAVRIDSRLQARIDPSDVVQESLMVAAQKLPGYLSQRPIPFYPWLRQIAWEQLVHSQERHVDAQMRSVNRETRWQLSDASVGQLADCFADSHSSPTRKVMRKEVQQRLRSALDTLAAHDREVLVMLYLEQMSINEIAATLEMTESGVKSRHRRALLKLTHILQDARQGPP